MKLEPYTPKLEAPDILNQMVLSLPYSSSYDIYTPHTLASPSSASLPSLPTQPIPHNKLQLPSISSHLWWPQDSKDLSQ